MWGTLIMAIGYEKFQYLGQVVQNGAKILVTRWYHERVDKNFLRYFTFQRVVHVIKGHFPRTMFIYKKTKTGETISNGDLNKDDIYLPDFYYDSIGYHIDGFVFSLPNSDDNIRNLLTPKINLMKDISPEKTNLFSKNTLKLPQETLFKTGIENYIKKLTVSFVNETYFLYDKSKLIKQTLVTEINKLLSIYGSVTYFD